MRVDWGLIAIVGKEERNKDFMANLVEDEHGNALGTDDLDAYRQEQGETSGSQENVVEEKIKPTTNDNDVQLEKMHIEHAERNKDADKQ